MVEIIVDFCRRILSLIHRNNCDAVKEYTAAKRNEFEEKNFRTSIPVMVYYGVKRAVIDIPLRINRHDYSLWDAYKDCFNGAANFRDFFCWFRNQEDIENEYKASERNDDTVELLASYFHPEE